MLMKLQLLLASIAISMASTSAQSQSDASPWPHSSIVVTASNGSNNNLLLYTPSGQFISEIPTGGKGGVSGNAGGISQGYGRLAVVNFGSGNVSVFTHHHAWLQFEQLVPAIANPVSVALGHDHLYILTSTHIESHHITAHGVEGMADGEASLLIGDGSAAQVGVLPKQLVFSEKTNAIETVNLSDGGAITGAATMVSNIPANVNAPFGLVTRGYDAYVTIAHANEISLVRDDTVQTVVNSGAEHAPCWVALDGPFLFSVNAASHTVSRYAVYGASIVEDAPVIASITGTPTDIAYGDHLAAVIDSNGTDSHVSIYQVDWMGNFTLQGFGTLSNISAANGVAVIRDDGSRN
jgi:hypothetical protein